MSALYGRRRRRVSARTSRLRGISPTRLFASLGVATAMLFGASVATAGAQPTAGNTGQPGPIRMVSVLADADRTVDVDVQSGNLLLTDVDLPDAAATYHVAYQRSYNSLSPVDGIIGKRWVLNVSPQVFITQTGSTATVHGPDGFEVTMDDAGNGSYTAVEGFDGTLVRASNGTYTLTKTSTGQQLSFDSQGALTGETDAAGIAFTVTNTSAAGKTVLSSFGTPDGRRINVSYNGDSRVREIDDPASIHRYYTYNANGYLATYQGPAGTTTYTYDTNGHMTSAAYPDGTSVTIVPLADGKTASVTVHRPDGSADQTWSFAYGAFQTTVTAPDGTQTTYYFGGNDLLVDEPEGLDAVADAYVADYGTSSAVATQWMVDQGRTEGAEDDIIASAAGPAFGGMWFDNDTRTIKVAMRSDAPAGVVQNIMNQHLVASVTDIVNADYSQHDLEMAQPGLIDSLQGLVDAGLVKISLDIPNNSIGVEIATTATPAQRQQVQDAAAESTVRVLVSDSEETQFGMEPLACSPTGTLPARCGSPLRGGVFMESLEENSDGKTAFCTTGFLAWGTGGTPGMTAGEPYMLTAGHCLSNFPDITSHWLYYGPASNAQIHDVGVSALYFYGRGTDVGAIHVTDDDYKSWVFRAESGTGSTSRMTDYPVRASAVSHVGQYLCLSGARWGTRCGRVSALGVPETIGNVPVRDFGELHSCGVDEGDSGGPIYIGFHAHGLVSGVSGCTVAFVGARTAEDRLGVRIGPAQ
jgi:YD repeat-containing protein